MLKPFRSVAVRLRSGNATYRTSVRGSKNNEAAPLLDTSGNPVSLPENGLLLTDYLAHVLQVRPGDMVTVEVMEGVGGSTRSH